MTEYPHLCRDCICVGRQYDTVVRGDDITVMLECPHCGRCWSVEYSSEDATAFRDIGEHR